MRLNIKNALDALLGRENVTGSLPFPDRKQDAEFERAVRGFERDYGFLTPSYPLEMLNVISILALINPDVSQTVHKIVALCNNGHSCDFSGTDTAIDAAAAELNMFARTAFPNKAGADGFINLQLRQLAITGALSQEAAPNISFSGIDSVYQVPVSTIRFKNDGGSYQAYQSSLRGDIKLNPFTYSIIPLETEEDKPYPIPPFFAAIKFILRQERTWEKVDEYTDKWGVLGLMWLTRNLRPQAGETEDEYMKRSGRILEKSYQSLSANMKKGVVVTDQNSKLETQAVSRATGGMDVILKSIEQMAASGLDIDPAMLGRSYSTTETYATVCYDTLIKKGDNMRRIIKRANENIYNMHLSMRKIPALVSIAFNPSPTLKAKEDIEVKQISQNMIYQRLAQNTIDADTAARELGYDCAVGKPPQASASFKYNSENGKYEFVRERISLADEKKKP